MRGWKAGSGGGVINAASLSVSDIQTAINAASTGYTVQLPSGTQTYNDGDNITCNKAIHIKGAGGGRMEGSSLTTNTIPTSSFPVTMSWTMQSGTIVSQNYSGNILLAFPVGSTVTACYKAHGIHFVKGTVTSWDGTTLTISIPDVGHTGGFGVYSCWAFFYDAATTLIYSNTTTDLFTLTESAAGHMEISDLMINKNTLATNGKGVFSCTHATNGQAIIFHDMRCTAAFPVDTIHAEYNGIIMYRMYVDVGFNWTNGRTVDARLINTKNFNADNYGWNLPDTFGAADTNGDINSYIEDSYFSGCGSITDWDDNARGVLRHSVLDNSGTATHGADTSSFGMLHTENYNILCLFDDLLNNNSTPVYDTLNMQCFFEWRGGTGIITDCQIPNITSASWGDKPEIQFQMQQLRRAPSAGGGAPFGAWGKNVNAISWNTANAPGIQYPAPRQCAMSHPNSGNVTTDVGSFGPVFNSNTSIAATYTAPDGAVLTGMSPGNTCYLGNLSPYYIWNCTGTGNYTNPTPEDQVILGPPDGQGGIPTDYDFASDYLQAGHDWFNIAKPGYTKFTYPHPMRSN